MDKFVVTSLRQGAGKTSFIIGATKALNRKIGYIKPFGERFLYRKKRLWDYDAALITHIFGLEENPENMSIGFYHSKLLSMLDEDTTREKLRELVISSGEGKEIFFAECGKDITYGVSVHLDALTIARDIDAKLIVVAGGDEETILDDVIFLKKYIQTGDVRFKGVIINKVANVADFCDTRLSEIQRHGVEVLGVIPYYKELPYFSVGYLADRLFAKIITGEENLRRIVKNIFIGSMSAGAALKNTLFQQESNLIITSGDQFDMIVAALGTNTSAIILTNNILPPSNLISKAAKCGIPLLLVSADTYEIAKQIEGMESLPTKDDLEKIALIEQMVRTHVNLQALMQP
ncbi:MAG: AAA family ATPase [Deltaproteobacteria bacterium]|nr:AAA family ATPase [Deltaproteobacteria bacterium]